MRTGELIRGGDAKAPPQDVVLRLKGIVKKFSGVVANDSVDFDLKVGEIHALLGENGAGKTTLVNVIYGLYQPDSGEIWIRGSKVNIDSPARALSLGIGMVHQSFTLVPSFSVVENVALGLKGFSSLRVVAEKVKQISELYGLSVDPYAKVWQLSVGEMQRVEIIKLLLRDVDILILDEPTSVLTPKETRALFSTLKRLKDEGKSVVFISHKLNEVMEISDRITVMRKGLVINTVRKEDTSPGELAKMMVGREISLGPSKRRSSTSFGEVVLEVKDLEAYGDKGIKVLRGLSFSVREGEILGIAGVAGNGQRELAEVLVGLRRASSGVVLFDGEDITNKGSMVFIEKGGGFIPEDRKRFGVAPNLSLVENLILKSYRKPPFSKGLFLDLDYANKVADFLIEKYSIQSPGKDMPVRLLSGGNLQRLVIARELEGKVRLLIAFHPTFGLDVGAMEFVYEKLLEAKASGTAVLLIAGDLDEIFTLSDRIKVIYEGKLYGDFPPDESYLETIGMLMAGVINGYKA